MSGILAREYGKCVYVIEVSEDLKESSEREV
jgi:hypothetical protein